MSNDTQISHVLDPYCIRPTWRVYALKLPDSQHGATGESGGTEMISTVTPLPTQRASSDCFSACLSWLLRLTQDEVPDFTDKEDQNSREFYRNVASFLNARGLRMMMIEWRDMPAWIGGAVIARGVSPRGKAHAVLWDDYGLMHDPHPSRAGLVGEPTHAMLILLHNQESKQ